MYVTWADLEILGQTTSKWDPLHIVLNCYFPTMGFSSGSRGRVGGPRNMKSMRLPLVAVLFMNFFCRAGGTCPPSPPDLLLGCVECVHHFIWLRGSFRSQSSAHFRQNTVITPSSNYQKNACNYTITSTATINNTLSSMLGSQVAVKQILFPWCVHWSIHKSSLANYTEFYAP